MINAMCLQYNFNVNGDLTLFFDRLKKGKFDTVLLSAGGWRSTHLIQRFRPDLDMTGFINRCHIQGIKVYAFVYGGPEYLVNIASSADRQIMIDQVSSLVKLGFDGYIDNLETYKGSGVEWWSSSSLNELVALWNGESAAVRALGKSFGVFTGCWIQYPFWIYKSLTVDYILPMFYSEIMKTNAATIWDTAVSNAGETPVLMGLWVGEGNPALSDQLGFVSAQPRKADGLFIWHLGTMLDTDWDVWNGFVGSTSAPALSGNLASIPLDFEPYDGVTVSYESGPQIVFVDYNVVRTQGKPSIRSEQHTGNDGNVAREVNSRWYSCKSGDRIKASCFMMVEPSGLGDGYGGARIGVDLYGAGGLLWGVEEETYYNPHNEVAEARQYVKYGTMTWTQRTIDFVVPANVNGAVPTSFVLWLQVWGLNGGADSARAWFADTELYLNPIVSPSAHALIVTTTPLTGVSVTMDGVAASTPTAPTTLTEGNHVVAAPLTVQVGTDYYDFQKWEDGTTNPTRTVNLLSDKTLTATYLLRYVPPPPPPTPTPEPQTNVGALAIIGTILAILALLAI